jgi:hypothetical protein
VNVDLRPSLYRVAVTALVVALFANILLWRVSSDDDAFANIIAAACGVAAALILVANVLPQLVRWREEGLLISFGLWVANALEFFFESAASWESRARQGGFYVAFAVLSLGTYLAQRIERET